MANNATGGNSAPNQGQDNANESENTVTRDELNAIVNAAITARNKAFEKKFDELKALFSAREESLQSTQGESVKSSNKADPEFVKLQKQLEAITERERTATAKARDTELRSTVKEKLLKAGVNPSQVKFVLASMVDAEKQVAYSEYDDGAIVARTANGEVDLDTHIKLWSKSDEAKAFLAPKGTAGSGDKNAFKTGSSQSNKLSNDEVDDLFFGLVK